MKRTQILQEIRKMEFERDYAGWRSKRLTQDQAAHILGVTARVFRRYINRFTDESLESLYDTPNASLPYFSIFTPYPVQHNINICGLSVSMFVVGFSTMSLEFNHFSLYAAF